MVVVHLSGAGISKSDCLKSGGTGGGNRQVSIQRFPSRKSEVFSVQLLQIAPSDVLHRLSVNKPRM